MLVGVRRPTLGKRRSCRRQIPLWPYFRPTAAAERAGGARRSGGHEYRPAGRRARAIFGDFEDPLRTLGGPRACGGEALHPGAGRTPSRARVPIAVLLTSLEDGSCTWAWGSIRGQAGKGGSATEVAMAMKPCQDNMRCGRGTVGRWRATADGVFFYDSDPPLWGLSSPKPQ